MAIKPIYGMYVHDETTDTDGIAKFSSEELEDIRVGSDGVTYANAGDAVRTQSDKWAGKFTQTRTNSGTKWTPVNVNAGEWFKVSTTRPNTVRFKDSETGTIKESYLMQAGGDTYFSTTVPASGIQSYFDDDSSMIFEYGRKIALEVAEKTALSEYRAVQYKQGGFSSVGNYVARTDRIHSEKLKQDQLVIAPPGFKILSTLYFGIDGYMLRYVRVDQPSYNIVKNGTETSAVIVFAAWNETDAITPDSIKTALNINYIELKNHVDELSGGLVTFEPTKASDRAASLAGSITYDHGQTAVYNQLSALFTELATDYPDYVTIQDAATVANLTYPSYADYTTQFVTISNANSNANGDYTKKKKMFLTAGIHGDEQAAPLNLYIMLKRMLEGDDNNLSNILGAFDLYIVPCVNGWGCINNTRWNYNGVNINRNFPIHNWVQTGTAFTDNYSGAAAGDQFETQLVCALFDIVKPDIAIDLHNYTYNIASEIYTDVWDVKALPAIYKAVVNISSEAHRTMYEYFGKNPSLLIDNMDVPAHLPTVAAYACRWYHEQGNNIAAAIEISDCINYVNGAPDTSARHEWFQPAVFKYGNLSVEEQIARLIDIQ